MGEVVFSDLSQYKDTIRVENSVFPILRSDAKFEKLFRLFIIGLNTDSLKSNTLGENETEFVIMSQ